MERIAIPLPVFAQRGEVRPPVRVGSVTETTADFASLGLGGPALEAVTALGYDRPTAVQARTIPLLLAGRDVIVQAPTGTGKTAAYALPIVERLIEAEFKTQALVVVPTRELAIQVAEAMHGFGRARQMVTLSVYGGQPYERQLRALARGVQVVIGTPGRLLDHLDRRTLKLDSVRTVVLDEADEMLDMGFLEDIEKLLAALPPDHQSALFSATIPARVQKLARQYLRDPEQISLEVGQAVAPRVRQVYYEVPFHGKAEALARILDLENPDSAIVFVRTRRDADVVAEHLGGLGHIAQAIHGDISQAQRERALERFRSGHTEVLVGTDVAARGLDIPDVSHVINYDLPEDAEAYVHRIGRTGRAGRKGEAVTLITPRERGRLTMIEKAIHHRLQPLRLPTPADVAMRRRETFREELLAILDAGELDPFIRIVEDLAATRDVSELAAAAFKMAAERGPAGRRGAAPPVPVFKPAPPRNEPPVKRRAASDARPAAHAAGARAGTVRLFLRVGKRHGVRPADLVGAIANEAGLAGDDIGDIDLYDTFSFVEVPAGLAAQVEAALNRSTIRGQAPQASLARPAEDASGSPPSGFRSKRPVRPFKERHR
ncbi:MAG: DEAD/DEAH box helicase [Candidatus Dormibacteraceae bacterium]